MGRRNVQAQFDPRDIQRMQDAIAAMHTITGRSIKACVQHVTGTLCWGIIHATPQARAKRRVVRAPDGVGVDWQAQRQSSRPADAADWAVEVYSQGPQRVSYLGYGTRAGALASPARDIRMRGLARATWRRAYAKAKAKGGRAEPIATGNTVAGGAERMSDGVLRAPRIDYAEAEIANRLPYVVILDRGGPHTPAHHIMLAGATKGYARQREWLRRMAAQYGRAWTSGRAPVNADS